MSKRTTLPVVFGCLAFVLVACGGSTPTAGEASASASAGAVTTAAVATSASPTRSGPVSTAARSSATATSSGPSGGADPAQAGYCEQAGGQVQTRTSDWGTNGGQADWLPLAGSTSMCRFQAADGSRIYVALTTLSSPSPTLAALAYLSKVPMPASTGGANPATGYCSKELGGSSTFGAVGAAGGGWVATDDPDDVVVSLCVFPDLSFIDEWGLAYHSDGSIRGTDLATVMQYQPDGQLPPVYGAGAATPTS